VNAAVLIVIAAFVAGAVNAISGGGTLIIFPVLLWTGMEPVIANTTNTVALWPGAVAALFARRRELKDMNRAWLLLSIPCLVGGLIGAVILIHSSPHVFRLLVPGLILFASLVLGAQELLYRNAERFAMESLELSGHEWAIVAGVLFFIAIYGGYFGAAIGILILALLDWAGLNDIHRMIALRILCATCANGAAAAYFSLNSAVDWKAAGLMAVAQVAGALIGTFLSRKIDAVLLRRSIVGFGVAMAGLLFRTA